MIFIAAWFIDISIYGCINVSTQNAGSDFLFVEFSSLSLSLTPFLFFYNYISAAAFSFLAQRQKY